MEWNGNTGGHTCEVGKLSQEARSVEKGDVQKQSSRVKEEKRLTLMRNGNPIKPALPNGGDNA